jgi:hypothetical protein
MPSSFTATVSPSTSTGTVTFSTLNNAVTTVLGTALVNLPYPTATTGTATLATTALPGGSNSVTGTYEGDGVNKLSTSAAVVVTVIAPDFTLGAAPTSTSVVAGHTSSAVTLTFTPINGFNQTITPSCTGLPTGATCLFSPATVTLDGTHSGTTSMTISTAASMAPATTPTVVISATGSGTTHTTNFSLTTSATDQTFTLSSTASSISVKQGGSGNTTITVVPGGTGFSTLVTFSCADTATESHCSVSPTSSATQTTLNITTTAPSAQLRPPFGRGTRIFYAAMLPGLLGIMFTMGSRRRSLRGARLLGLIFLLGFSTLWLGSCSGSNGGTKDSGTPPGTYSITVSATTGGAVPVTNTNTTFAVSLVVTQ